MTGLIETYRGIPQIEATAASQIVIYSPVTTPASNDPWGTAIPIIIGTLLLCFAGLIVFVRRRQPSGESPSFGPQHGEVKLPESTASGWHRFSARVLDTVYAVGIAAALSFLWGFTYGHVEMGPRVLALSCQPDWQSGVLWMERTSPASPAWSPDGSQIAFTSNRDRKDRFVDIYVMDTDGGNARRLTGYPGFSLDPAWSPNGSQIAFTSNREGGQNIFVMDADGLNIRQLTDEREDDSHPTWSPDGTQIAFTRNRDIYDFGVIYVMDADGRNVRLLTDDLGLDWNPTGSPDGSQIAFTSNHDGTYDIYVMDADGFVKKLTDAPGLNFDSPAWSPDGSRIAFTSNRDGGQNIFVMDADGVNLRQLTDEREYDSHPAWSPDGTQIAFTRNRDRTHDFGDIYVMDTDGGNVRRPTGYPGFSLDPAWSPDGSQIAFTSNRDGGQNIFVMDADGVNIRQLTDYVAPTYDREEEYFGSCGGPAGPAPTPNAKNVWSQWAGIAHPIVVYLSLLLLWLLEVVPGPKGAGSLGYRTLNLRIQAWPEHRGRSSLTARLWGRALLRSLLFVIPLVNIICLIALAIDKNKRSWYDKAAGTVVVKL